MSWKKTTDKDAIRLFNEKVDFYNKTSKSRQLNFYSSAEGMLLMQAGTHAFHVVDGTAYKIIRDTFTEKQICDITEITMFPNQNLHMIAAVQKNSPFREMITYG